MVKKKKAVVAMSGGVDSSVAVLLLKEAGYDVTGLTMAVLGMGEHDTRAVESAKKTAAVLEIRHEVIDLSSCFDDEIVGYFISEYENGRTPNPCVRCNRRIKFGRLLDHAISLGADCFATGHYARILKDPLTGEYSLRKAKDLKKDQSYFLYNIKKENLDRIKFPLGELTKSKCREIARENKLPVFDRPESEDACFLESRSYSELLLRRGLSEKEGEIRLRDGTVVGKHSGYFNFTIGQRKGLGIGWTEPLYVLKIEPEGNFVIVGTKADTFASRVIAGALNFLTKPEGDLFDCKVRIRYRHKEDDASVRILDNDKAEIIFDRPQNAVTPGQSVVFYDVDKVIGGGIILNAE
jgi:tRNA-specific 2-thiouridylase